MSFGDASLVPPRGRARAGLPPGGSGARAAVGRVDSLCGVKEGRGGAPQDGAGEHDNLPNKNNILKKK